MNLEARGLINYLLLPVSALFYLLTSLRRLAYRSQLFKTQSFEKPVIVVGNITAGGTGKTPIVIALCQHFARQNKRVGVVSRGYGGSHTQGSFWVDENSDPGVCGDEPLLIALSTQAQVVVNKDRPQAVQALIDQHQVDVVISDDGLQHYAMGRDIEIAVVDGSRRFGNGFLLPAGPLREGRSRLKTVDFVLNNGALAPAEIGVELKPLAFVNLVSGERKPLDFFYTEYCHAIAGIGNPQRFFTTLTDLHIHVNPHPFADHHHYQAQDLDFGDSQPIIMTSKDWVKCRDFANENMYYLDISTQIGEDFYHKLDAKLWSTSLY